MEDYGALLPLFLAQVGTLLTLLYTHRQNRAMFRFQRHIEVSTSRLAQQLGDFYGPLNLLLERASAIGDFFRNALLAQEVDRADAILGQALLPLLDQIRDLIMIRGHLLDARDSPRHYLALLRHIDAFRLRFGPGAVAAVPHLAFPRTLPGHVQQLYDLLREEYENKVREGS